MRQLLAVCGLPYSRSTIAFARAIAIQTGAETALLNVAESDRQRSRSEAILAEALVELDHPVVQTMLRVGRPIDEILLEIHRGNYGLLVIGAREQFSLNEVVLGSIARKLVAKAPISVLVVKGDRTGISRVLIGTGGRRYADSTVQEAISLASAIGAQVTLLYVVMPSASMFTGLKQVHQKLSTLLQTDTPEARHLRRAAQMMEASDVKGEIRLRHGPVVDEILREAGLGDYDLIVLGAPQSRTPLGRYVWGDIAGQVLDRTQQPVLVSRGSLGVGLGEQRPDARQEDQRYDQQRHSQ